MESNRSFSNTNKPLPLGATVMLEDEDGFHGGCPRARSQPLLGTQANPGLDRWRDVLWNTGWVTLCMNGSDSQEQRGTLPTLACLQQLLGKRSPKTGALASQQVTQGLPMCGSPCVGPRVVLLPLSFLPFPQISFPEEEKRSVLWTYIYYMDIFWVVFILCVPGSHSDFFKVIL